MDIHTVPDWETFEQQALKKLHSTLGKRAATLLFRGQGNSEWPLTTTLERAGQEGMGLSDFYRLIASRIRPAVETFTGVTWDVDEYSEDIEKSFFDIELFSLRRFPVSSALSVHGLFAASWVPVAAS